MPEGSEKLARDKPAQRVHPGVNRPFVTDLGEVAEACEVRGACNVLSYHFRVLNVGITSRDVLPQCGLRL
jgi:hypothetical protein